MHPLAVDVTEYVASMYPFCGLKNSCTPLLACSSVKLCVLVGSCPGDPHAVAVNVRDALLAYTVDVISLSDAGRSGVRKYSNAGTVRDSRTSPVASESRSYAVMDARASRGKMMASCIAAHA